MADEVIGPGTQLSGTSLGAVLTLRDVEGPNEEADDIEVSSNVDAVVTAGINFRKRFRPGMVDPGEVKFTAVFTTAGYSAARSAIRTQQAFTITLENASTITLGDESYIKSVSPSYPWEEEAVYDVVIKASSEPTVA